MVAAAIMAVHWSGGALAQDIDSMIVLPGDPRIDPVEFQSYEVEYGSAFGRFFNEVRPFTLDGKDKISVVNTIAMPTGVIVDHRIIDAKTMRFEDFYSPYFAWGDEFLVGRNNESHYEWLRVPLGGGAPTRMNGALVHGGFFDDLGFSPTYAAFLPLPTGTTFFIPKMQPRRDESVRSVLVAHEVVDRETLTVGANSWDCWVIEERSADGSVHRYWIAREAPFLIKRHRDIGGQRDTVSDIKSFRVY